MLKLAHLALLLAFCCSNAIGEQNGTRQGRYYDVAGGRTIPLALLLRQNEISNYRRNLNDETLAFLLNPDNAAQFRQNPFGLSNINNAVNPFATFFNRVPRPYIRNPDSPTLTNVWQSCQDDNGLAGTCVPATVCAKYGGRPSGACGFGSVCCVNSVNGCGGQVTLNNTYWRSATTVSSGSTCGLTVTLDDNLVEQKTKICQVRLDFVSFTIAQPNAESVCATDTFRTGGTTNNVPVICGDNDGQHMYLNVASPVSQLQLVFNFGSSTVTRAWNIRISMLPCGATFLAPKDCLQYFTQTSGDVKSFNWKDVVETTTRQLANQDYKICFRAGLVNNGGATRLCVTPCSVTAALTAFSVSRATDGAGTATPNVAQSAVISDCNNDYIILEDGFDPAGVASGGALLNPGTCNAAGTTCNVRDRFCGERLNVATAAPANANSATVCSTVKPFAIVYRTNGGESTGGATVDANPVGTAPTNGNLGFCLSFTQRSL